MSKKISHWNVYERTSNGLPRTNNAVEGWHSGLNKIGFNFPPFTVTVLRKNAHWRHAHSKSNCRNSYQQVQAEAFKQGSSYRSQTDSANGCKLWFPKYSRLLPYNWAVIESRKHFKLRGKKFTRRKKNRKLQRLKIWIPLY